MMLETYPPLFTKKILPSHMFSLEFKIIFKTIRFSRVDIAGSFSCYSLLSFRFTKIASMKLILSIFSSASFPIHGIAHKINPFSARIFWMPLSEDDFSYISENTASDSISNVLLSFFWARQYSSLPRVSIVKSLYESFRVEQTTWILIGSTWTCSKISFSLRT